jgi:hypothetical protein
MMGFGAGFGRLGLLWRSPGGWRECQDLHRCLAQGAEKGRPGPGCTGFYENPQDPLDQAEQLFGPAVQEAIVSDPAKAFGQDMLQDQPHEVMAPQGAVKGFTAAALDVAEGDLALLMGDDLALTDDAPVEIARQVLEGGKTFSGMRAVDHPFGGRQRGRLRPALVNPSSMRARNTRARANSLKRYLLLFFFHCFLALSTPPPGTTTWT